MAIDLPPPTPNAIYISDWACHVPGGAFRVLETASGSVIMHIESGRLASQRPRDKDPEEEVQKAPEMALPREDEVCEENRATGSASGNPVAIPGSK